MTKRHYPSFSDINKCICGLPMEGHPSRKIPQDASFHMWEYWRDDKGLKTALTEYYTNALEESSALKTGLEMIKNGELLINAYMQKRAEWEKK